MVLGLQDRMKDIKYVHEYQTIIAMVTENNEKDEYITIQEVYFGENEFTTKDFHIGNWSQRIEKWLVFHDECYRDDTINKQNQVW